MTTTIEPSIPPSAPSGPTAPTRRRGGLSRFWVGFVLGFLLLSISSCGILILSTGLNRIDLTTLQSNGPVWTPPAVTATPVVEVNDPNPNEGQVLVGSFAIGESLRNMTSSLVNVRQTAGHVGKPSGDVIAQLQPNDTVEVLEGPVVADNLTWWRLRARIADGRSVEGWVAEATQSGVQILGR